MNCFGCFGEDDLKKHGDGGGHYAVKNSAGNSVKPFVSHYI